jgi:hypothetical protein
MLCLTGEVKTVHRHDATLLDLVFEKVTCVKDSILIQVLRLEEWRQGIEVTITTTRE